MEKNKETSKAKEASSKKTSLAHGVGRRKSSVARVWLKRGSGKITINKRPYKDYFQTEVTQASAYKPFEVYPQAAKSYDVQVNVCGGGICSQADAVKLAVSRALVKMNEELKPVLKEFGLLTVDARLKERKKPGQKGARRKFQFVKR